MCPQIHQPPFAFSELSSRSCLAYPRPCHNLPCEGFHKSAAPICTILVTQILINNVFFGNSICQVYGSSLVYWRLGMLSMFPAITSPNNDPGGRGGVLILEEVVVRVNRIRSSFPEAGYRSKRTRDLELNPKPCICIVQTNTPLHLQFRDSC